MKFKSFFSILISLTFLFSYTVERSSHSTYANSSISKNTFDFQIQNNVNFFEDSRIGGKTTFSFEYLGDQESGIIFKIPYTFKTNRYDQKSGFGDFEFGIYFIASSSSEIYSRYNFLYRRTIIGDYISPVIMGNITSQNIGGISYSIDLDKINNFFITSKFEYLYISGTSLEFESDLGFPDFIEPKQVINFNADVIIEDLKKLLPENLSVLAGLNYHYSNTRVELTNINTLTNYLGESILIDGQQYYPTEGQASSVGIKGELAYRILGKISMDLRLRLNLSLYNNFNASHSINLTVKPI